jgi:hypothetical protein
MLLQGKTAAHLGMGVLVIFCPRLVFVGVSSRNTGVTHVRVIGAAPISTSATVHVSSVQSARDTACWQVVSRRACGCSHLQLQQEQARLKEEFSRQAGLMEQVSKDASSAVSERDRAWQEVERLRIALGGGDVRAPELRGERLRHSLSADTLDSFVVSTHLLPRDANTIPTR